MEVESSSVDEDEINQLLTQREVPAMCKHLANYTFAHGIESRAMLVFATKIRNTLNSSLRQTSITKVASHYRLNETQLQISKQSRKLLVLLKRTNDSKESRGTNVQE
uniref:Uncharacterized protein n=1 Tax=Hyaloperonospora arabidopsidis (strain Emoy2) TaxID=559515 RepID=M4B5S9_HYAAE